MGKNKNNPFRSSQAFRKNQNQQSNDLPSHGFTPSLANNTPSPRQQGLIRKGLELPRRPDWQPWQLQSPRQHGLRISKCCICFQSHAPKANQRVECCYCADWYHQDCEETRIVEEYVGPREDLYKEPFACSDCRRRLGKNVQVGKKSGEKEHGGSEEQEGKVKKKTDGEGKRNDDGDVAMSG